MSNNINSILKDLAKCVEKTGGANGVLARLFRQMLLDLKVGPNRYNDLLQDYILDPRNGVPNNKKDQVSVKGNLNKEFARAHMTWKVFMKALRFLNIVKIELTINALHKNGSWSRHGTTVKLGHLAEDIDNEE